MFAIIISSLIAPVLPIQEAHAVTVVEWRQGGSSTSAVPLNSGDAFGLAPLAPTIHITDSVLGGNAIANEVINVVVTSDVDPTGIIVTLTETGTSGVFDSGKIIMMHGSDLIPDITSTVTITIEDSTCGGSCDAGAPDVLSGSGFEAVSAFSNTDTTGISLDLTETGDDTKIFTGTLEFSSSSSSGNTLEAAAGDTISIIDDVDFETMNFLIAPSGSSNIGAINAVPASVGTVPGSTYEVTATYDGVSDVLGIQDDGAGGRGSGGLIRPGIVVDSVSSGSTPESGNGSGCDGDCLHPTLGIDSNMFRLVENGFSYNNNPVNVELYYTPYPLVTANVGQENKVELKIYDDGGTSNIEHVGLGFGLGTNESFEKSRATINLDRTRDGQELVSTYDPQNVLDDVKIITETIPCNSDGLTQCLKVTIFHTFRDSLEFNMLATYIWDFKRNAWHNYYNHGIHIDGESLNPPNTLLVAFGTTDMRGLYQLTQLDKIDDTWTDEYDNIYQHKGNHNFEKIFSPQNKITYDSITTHGCDRNCNWFYAYKLNQEYLGQDVLDDMLHGKIITNDVLETPFSHSFDISDRFEDKALQNSIEYEKNKALEQFAKLYDVENNH